MPAGTGKTVRVAVLLLVLLLKLQKPRADVVGLEDLVASVKGGNLDFDVVIAEPSAMRFVGQLGQILGHAD